MNNLFNNEMHELDAAQIQLIQQEANCLNEDSKPVAINARSWSGWNFFTLWLGMMISIPVYMLASGLISQGMNYYQAVFVIVFGHTLVMIPAVLLGHFGTRYGGSFSILSKLVFGPVGNFLPTMTRALLGCFWFGVQCWIGGQAIDAILAVFLGSIWKELSIHIAISFAIFFALNVYIAYYGAKGIKYMQNFAAPILVFLGLAVVAWAYNVANGDIHKLLTASLPTTNKVNFWVLFFPALSAMIAFDGTLALNTADFTRNAKSQKGQFWGQIIGAPLMTFFICTVGVIGTNASLIAFGKAIWNPTELIAQFHSPLIVVGFSFFVILATMTTNIAGNLIPPGMVFTSLFAKHLNYKKAILAASFLSILGQPWNVLSDPNNYIKLVLGNLATFLGPMAGIYIASYWFEHKTQVSIVDLYLTKSGKYYYKNGINISALVVLFAVTAVCFFSQFIPSLSFIYNNSYVLGAIVTFVVYYFAVIKNKII